jgi:thymidine phosphorylase
VKAGEALITMHYNDIHKANAAEKMVLAAYCIKDKPVVNKEKLITQRID